MIDLIRRLLCDVGHENAERSTTKRRICESCLDRFGFGEAASLLDSHCKILFILFLSAVFTYLVCSHSAAGSSFEIPELPDLEDEVIFLNESAAYSVLLTPHFQACERFLEPPILFIAVMSLPTAFDVREAIRESWASVASSEAVRVETAVICFITGSSNESTVMEKIALENAKYGDILQTSIQDHYRNLTLKVYSAMAYKRESCGNAKFFVKVDDDVVVHVDRLVNAAKSMKNNTIYGRLWEKAKPRRDPGHKWYVSPHRFNGTYFPDYVAGPTYVIPKDALEALWQELGTVPSVAIEDVFYTGIVAEKARILRQGRADLLLTTPPIPSSWRCGQDREPLLVSVHSFKNASTILESYTRLEGIRCAW